MRRLLAALLLAAAAAAQASPGLTPAAQADYMLNCMGCHLSDGSGAPARVPSLRRSLLPLAMSAAGRRYLVQVPGASQAALSDAELAAVLNWMVRNLSAPGATSRFAQFTAAEVGRYRVTPLVDVRATRTRVLAAMPATAPR